MTDNTINQGRSGGQKKLIERIGDKYGVDANKMLSTLTATAFRQKNDQPISNEQMMALLVVADQYNLNPFTKEIYAFPDKNAGIVPIVGVDGWSRIINEHDAFDGMDFEASDEFVQLDNHHKKCPEYITCRMYRKDRSRPVEITEYLDEVYREPFQKNGQVYKGPWQSHTKRFLRHKAMIQCARLAFGFVGIFDQDEAERIVQGDVVSSERNGPAQRQEQPAAIPDYSAEAFNRSFDSWASMIEDGRKSPDQVIAMASTKGVLSDDQKEMIRAVAGEETTEA